MTETQLNKKWNPIAMRWEPVKPGETDWDLFGPATAIRGAEAPSSMMVYNYENFQFEPQAAKPKSMNQSFYNERTKSNGGVPVRTIDNSVFLASLQRKPSQLVKQLVGREFDICGDLPVPHHESKIKKLEQAEITDFVKFITDPEAGQWIVVKKNKSTTEVLNFKSRKLVVMKNSLEVEISEPQIEEQV